MKLAESVRVRWVLAAACLAFAGSAAALIGHSTPGATVRTEQRDPMAIGGCHQHAAKKVAQQIPQPPSETTGDMYGDALLAVRPALEACMKNSNKQVSYRLSVDVGTDGSILSVDVRSEATDMRKVSLKTTQCLERAVSTAKFPVSSEPTFTRVSTDIRPDSP